MARKANFGTTIEQGQHERLRAVSARTKVPMAEIVRAGIERELRRHEEVGARVECRTCARTKAPRGRDVAAACHDSYCTPGCPGYGLDPRSGDLWPGESRAEFGF